VEIRQRGNVRSTDYRRSCAIHVWMSTTINDRLSTTSLGVDNMFHPFATVETHCHAKMNLSQDAT
jgi:hypothetical protein